MRDIVIWTARNLTRFQREREMPITASIVVGSLALSEKFSTFDMDMLQRFESERFLSIA